MISNLVIAGQVVSYDNDSKILSIQSINAYNKKHPHGNVLLFRHITIGSKQDDNTLLQRLSMGNLTYDELYTFMEDDD